MESGILLFTIGVFGVAGVLAWRDHQPHYLFALVAGQIATLLSPFWQWLYGFSYDPSLGALFSVLDRSLPIPVFLAGWTLMLPPLAIFFLSQRRWWFSGYFTGALTFVLFTLYHILIETIGVRAGWWEYVGDGALPFNISVTLLSGLMNGLVSLGGLAVLLITRHYAWHMLLAVILPTPLLMSVMVHGLLGAPLYTVVLLRAQSWAAAIGMIGTLGLVLWGAHIIASELGRRPMPGRVAPA
ncbi:MAG: hypothetical protein ACUVSY_08290 [Roseiflexus sp.]